MIQIRDLVKSFDTKDRVLDCVDLNVEKVPYMDLLVLTVQEKLH